MIDLNQQALAMLRCPKQLVIVPGATHLFEEPGALEQVAELTRDWFDHYFKTSAAHGTAGPTAKPVSGNTG